MNDSEMVNDQLDSIGSFGFMWRMLEDVRSEDELHEIWRIDLQVLEIAGP